MLFLVRNIYELDLILFNTKYPGVSLSYSAKILRKLIGPLRTALINLAIKNDRQEASRILSNLTELETLYQDYTKESKSTGVSVSDYVRLYKIIRKLKPKAVLECGTGLTTTAIALALKHNYEEYNIMGKCVSMEALAQWYEHAVELFPEFLSGYVEIVLSRAVKKEFNGYVGLCYDEIPQRDYEFVFIDGPCQSYKNQKMFNMDIMFIADKNPMIKGLIDHRLFTIFYLKKALSKTHYILYNPISKLGYILPRKHS